MPAVEYSPANLSEIERTLSAERIQLDQPSADGNMVLAIQLYEHKTLLAESPNGVLKGLEVSLRNTIHAHRSQPATVRRNGGTQ
jgi:hypothetical protein